MDPRLRGAVMVLLLLAGPATAAGRGDSRRANKLAAEFNVPAGRLIELHDGRRMSWRDIRRALVISGKSGATLDDIARLRVSGLGMREIAARYGLDWDEVRGAGARDLRDAPASNPYGSGGAGPTQSHPQLPTQPDLPTSPQP